MTAISKKMFSFLRKIVSAPFYLFAVVFLWIAIVFSGNYEEKKEMIEIDGFEISKENYPGEVS